MRLVASAQVLAGIEGACTRSLEALGDVRSILALREGYRVHGRAPRGPRQRGPTALSCPPRSGWRRGGESQWLQPARTPVFAEEPRATATNQSGSPAQCWAHNV